MWFYTDIDAAREASDNYYFSRMADLDDECEKSEREISRVERRIRNGIREDYKEELIDELDTYDFECIADTLKKEDYQKIKQYCLDNNIDFEKMPVRDYLKVIPDFDLMSLVDDEVVENYIEENYDDLFDAYND